MAWMAAFWHCTLASANFDHLSMIVFLFHFATVTGSMSIICPEQWTSSSTASTLDSQLQGPSLRNHSLHDPVTLGQ
jgi:hypothetical protein